MSIIDTSTKFVGINPNYPTQERKSAQVNDAQEIVTMQDIADTVYALYPTPSNPIPITTALLATAGVLSFEPFYDNGTDGVGATLSALSDGILRDTSGSGKIDGSTDFEIGDTILVKDQRDPIENGIYIVIDKGSISTPYVLERIAEYNEGSEMFPLQVNVILGSTNGDKIFLQQTQDVEIGVSDIVFEQANSANTFAQIRFVDTATSEPMPAFTYNPTTKIFTADVVGYLGNIGGLFATINPNIEGGFTRFLVKDEIDNRAYNGTMQILNTGSETAYAQWVRVDTFSTEFTYRQRTFMVSKVGSTMYGKQYFVQPNTPPLTTAQINTAKIIFEEVGLNYIITDIENVVTNLIPNNLIEIGKKYIVTGCHVSLYDDGNSNGTTLILEGIASNALSKNGHGIFYNPSYNQEVAGFGIWTDLMQGTLTPTLGTFSYFDREALIGKDDDDNNVADGFLFSNGLIQFVSGDWSLATKVVGGSSSAEGTVSGFVNPTVDAKTIYGGYVWENGSAQIGTATDVLNLDGADWVKVEYNLNDYNQSIDIIEYDIDNDWISRRYDPIANIDVVYTFSDYNFIGLDYSAIAVQQWGNTYNGDVGVGNKKILNSYDESVNFRGKNQTNLFLPSYSQQVNLFFEGNSSQNNLEFGNNSYQSNLIFDNNSNQNNLIFDNNSRQIDLIFSNSNQVRLTLNNRSGQSDLLMENSSQTDLFFINSNCNYQGVYYESKQILNTYFNNISSNTIPDLSSATYIFDSYPKTVYTRPDGQLRLSFMNNSNDLDVVEIDA
jgi:hypothetical protein